MSVFRRPSPQEVQLLEQDVLHDPIANLPRKQLLTIQFCKCINYASFDTSPDWGGQSHGSDQTAIERGYQRFLEDVDGFGAESAPRWLHKKLAALPWGPDNFYLRSRPDPELGYPFEPYLTVGGAILTINQASRILSIERMELVEVKCAVLLDQAVIDTAIRRMLEPRPLWPRIRLKRGGKGRSYRFIVSTH